VWKNISVVDDLPGTQRTTGFTVANFDRKPQDVSLQFSIAREERDLLRWGRVLIDVPTTLAEKLRKSDTKGVKWLSPTTLEITSANGALGGRVRFRPREMHALSVRFVRKGTASFGARVLNLDLAQFNGAEIVGGVRFAVRTHAATQFEGQDLVADHVPGPRDGGNWIGKAPVCGRRRRPPRENCCC
jgi:hypothetical protein